mgnify:CR=1 FL=1
MSWGIEFQTDIYLSRQEYKTKYEVEDRIKELSNDITDCESKLKMYAIATPKDIVHAENAEDIFDYINQEVLTLLEWYEELIIDRFKLNLYLEYLDEGGEIKKNE